MKQFDLIVIGAGISGMAVAMRAVEAGMRVVVIDDHATVAEGASFFHSGMVLPPPLDPWYGPDAPLTTPGGVPWRRDAREQAADAQRHAQLAAWLPLITQSRTRLEMLSRHYDIEHERRDGALYVWQQPAAFARARKMLESWPVADADADADANANANANAAKHAAALASTTTPDADGTSLDTTRAPAPSSAENSTDSTPDAAEAVTSPVDRIGAASGLTAGTTPDLASTADLGTADAAPSQPFMLYGQTARILDADACRAAEPALAHAETLAGGIAFDSLASGNAAVMAKRLKQLLDAADVTFLQAREAIRIDVRRDGVVVSIRPAQQAVGAFSGVQARGFTAPSTAPILGLDTRNTDPARHVEEVQGAHVVIAAGAGSARLLSDVGITLPLRRIVRTSQTGSVLREHYAPRQMVVDAEHATAIVRFERRVRVSACFPETGKMTARASGLPPRPSSKALKLMASQVHEWCDALLPGAARFDTAAVESDALVGADGLPVIGTLRDRAHSGRLHLVLSGSHKGWGLAFGAADLLFSQWPQATTDRLRQTAGDAAPTAASPAADAKTAVDARSDASPIHPTAPAQFDEATRRAFSPGRFAYD